MSGFHRLCLSLLPEERSRDVFQMSPQSPTNIELFRLGPFTVPRIWLGLWQLSSNAWGTASTAKIRQGAISMLLGNQPDRNNYVKEWHIMLIWVIEHLVGSLKYLLSESFDTNLQIW
jgi:hypothetical protein